MKVILRFEDAQGKQHQKTFAPGKQKKLLAAIAEFDETEWRDDFIDAFNGWRWRQIVTELDEWLKRQIKYSDKNEYEPARDQLHEIVDAEGLRIWH